MNETKYTIRVNYKNGSHRFVKWCNEHWFETTHEPAYILSLQEAERICFLMEKHYIPDMSILGTDGSERDMGAANRKKEQPAKPTKEEVRKNIFILNKNILRK